MNAVIDREYRSPAWSNEAEQAVLGALMLDAKAMEQIALAASDFHDAAHRTIFATMQAEIAHRRGIDSLSLYSALEQAGSVGDVGGLAYLTALEGCVVSPRSIKRHAEIVKDRSRQRMLLAAADEACEIAKASGPVAERVEKIAALFAAMQRQHVEKLPRSISELATLRTAHYEALQAGSVEAGWKTHIPALDDMLSGGLRPGGLYILAARPKVGKSSLAQTLSMTMAKAGRPTLFLSQEMGAEEVADRAVSNAGRVNYGNLLSGRMEDSDWSRAVEALDEMRDMPLFVDDQGSLTLLDIKAKARTVPGLKVLVLDYLQLSGSTLTDSNRNAQIEELSRGLKWLAKQMGIAVIALSQLNREVEKRANKRPQLSDLRDSGAIEQDADAVLFLWHVREYEAQGRRLIGLAVEANRQGRCGSVGLDFHGAIQRWGESTETLDTKPMTGGRRSFDE